MSAEPPLAQRWEGLRDAELLHAGAFSGRGAELAAVREAARGGLGAARVFDGHRNGLERLLVHRPDRVDASIRDEVAAGALAVGVWGADPAPGDGEPAVLDEARQTVSGTKVFCSGAGFVDVAIVLVRRAPDAPPTLPALVDVRERTTVDRDWFGSAALRESHSHRVVFDRAAVLAVLGDEGALTVDPWISGDALRSAAVWAGGADVLAAATADGARPGDDGSIERAGRAAAIIVSVDALLASGLAAVEAEHHGDAASWPVVAALRLELTDRIRVLMRLVAEQGGSRLLATAGAVEETRAGLDLLLLQHRLDPVARRLGAHGAERRA